MEQSGNEYNRKNLDAFRVYTCMLSGQTEPVREWLEYRAPREYELFIILDRYCYFVKIYAYIMLDQTESAQLILQRMLEYTRSYHRIYDELNMRILAMILSYRQGDDSWKKQLDDILVETEKYGMVRIYADKGNLIYPVLKKYEEMNKNRKKLVDAKYYEKIMEQTRKEALLYPNFLKQRKEHEELSVQEMDVLRLLCQGMKNADIAKELFLSENTVKYHLKKVFQKLQASSRSEAITRAREWEIV